MNAQAQSDVVLLDAARSSRTADMFDGASGSSASFSARAQISASLDDLAQTRRSLTAAQAHTAINRAQRGLRIALGNVTEGASPQQTFELLDSASRQLRSVRAPADMTGQAGADVTAALRGISVNRQALEGLMTNRGLFGRAGEQSEAITALTADNATRQAHLFRRLGIQATDDADGGGAEIVREIGTGRISAMFREAGLGRSDELTRVVEDYLSSSDAARRALRDAVPGLDQNELAAADVGARAIREAVQDGRERSRVLQQARDAVDNESREKGLGIVAGVSGVGLGIAAGTLVGDGPLGGTVGGIAALAAGAMLRPGSAMVQLAKLEGAFESLTRRRLGGLGRLRATLQGRGGRLRTVGRVGTRKVPVVVTRLASREHREQEYRETTDRLRELVSNPQLQEEWLGATTGHLAANFPTIQTGIAMTHIRGLQYLASKLPPVDRIGAFDQLNRLPPSATEIDVFMRRLKAVEDPYSILEGAADFTLSGEEAEAVAAVYPEIFSRIQADVAGLIGDLERQAPYQARVSVGTLLQVPADPSLEPSFINALQSPAAQTRSQDRAQRTRVSNSVTIADNTFSESQQISQKSIRPHYVSNYPRSSINHSPCPGQRQPSSSRYHCRLGS